MAAQMHMVIVFNEYLTRWKEESIINHQKNITNAVTL